VKQTVQFISTKSE